jgi:hypothetical protein
MTNPRTPERITYRIAALRALTTTALLGVQNAKSPLRETIDLRVPIGHMAFGESLTAAVDLAMRHIAIAANREPDTFSAQVTFADLRDDDPNLTVVLLCRRAADSLAREVEPSMNDREIARRILVHLSAGIRDGTADLYNTSVLSALEHHLRLYQGMSDHPTCVIRAALTGLGNMTMVGEPVPGRTILCDLHPGSGFLDVDAIGLLPDFIRRAADTIAAQEPGNLGEPGKHLDC